MNDEKKDASVEKKKRETEIKEAKKELRKERNKRITLGIYLMIMASALTIALFIFWPPNAEAKIDDNLILLLVLLTGALGSYVHSATSFVTYVGNRSMVKSWYWWYILRPFIGMALALIFYFVIRGGLLSTGATSKSIDLFGIAAVSGLVGMFSKQATDKLREIFDSLFKTDKGDELRKDKLNENLPVDERMLPFNDISKAILPAPENKDDIPAKHISIDDLLNKLHGVVTRIPVLDSNCIVKYVIHQSLLYKFIAQKTIKKENVDTSLLTLDDFLKYKNNGSNNESIVSASLAFIPLNSTLGAAKEKMESTENCQDVFITQNGTREEPILGWLTNIEISKSIKTP